MGAYQITLGTDYLETTRLRFTNPAGLPRLTTRDLLEDITIRTADGDIDVGTPSWWSDDDPTNLTFNVKADRAFEYVWIGYRAPAALSGANETNFLTIRYPSLLRYACLMVACEHERMWDDRDKYRVEAEFHLKKAQAANNLARNRMDRVPVVV